MQPYYNNSILIPYCKKFSRACYSTAVLHAMHGVLFIFSYYFLNLRSIIFLQSPKQVHIERSKCEHAVANMMLAFKALYVEMLRWPDRFSHVQLPRFASQHHTIFLPRRIKHACSVKHLEFRNVPCAVLRFRPGAKCNMPGNPRQHAARAGDAIMLII